MSYLSIQRFSSHLLSWRMRTPLDEQWHTPTLSSTWWLSSWSLQCCYLWISFFSWVGPGKPGTTPLRMWTSLDRRGLPKFARRWGCRGLCICPTLMPGRSQRSPSSREGAGSWPPSTRVSWRSRQSSPRQPSSGSATKQIYAINLIKVLWCVRWVGQLHQLLVLKVEET